MRSRRFSKSWKYPRMTLAPNTPFAVGAFFESERWGVSSFPDYLDKA